MVVDVVVAGSVVVVVVVVATVDGTVTSIGVVGVVADVTMTGWRGGIGLRADGVAVGTRAARARGQGDDAERGSDASRALRGAIGCTGGASFTIQVTSCPSSVRCGGYPSDIVRNVRDATAAILGRTPLRR